MSAILFMNSEKNKAPFSHRLVLELTKNGLKKGLYMCYIIKP